MTCIQATIDKSSLNGIQNPTIINDHFDSIDNYVNLRCQQTVLFMVSSQTRKSEFRVFSIVHLNIYNF